LGRHQFNCDSRDIVVIVSVTRDDLRDEFAMADEAFALSPISARAAQPSEEDYEAISQAFMETSRGRWFLGEYAKRNRNADTRMVLDAVARIEETLAAQKQPAPESGLVEALVAIRRAVDEAQTAAAAALDGLALEQHLAPVRKGARVIKEIAWRWREIGADGRICDLLDSQVGAIEGACGQISSAGASDALSAAFDLIKQRIAEFGDGDTRQETSATNNAEAAMGTSADAVVKTAEAAVLTVEAAEVTAEAPDMSAEVHDVASEASDVSPEAAEAFDEAVLDMIALEMAAPDASDVEPGTGSDEIQAADSPPANPIIVAERPEPVATPAEPPALQHSIQPSLQPSLGSTLIANGIVRRPNASVADPLAPIRRMSQAEKIALFS
jgi:hypothetical protein